MSSRESIFFSSIRAFCVSFFAVIGISIAFFIVMLVLAGIIASGGREHQIVGNYSLLPDANGHIEPLNRSTPLILHLDLAGIIGGETLTAAHIRDQLERSQQGSLEGRVHGVLLHINSPGGSAFDSNAIYRAVKQYAKRYQVPVYAWVDGLCASGGVYSAVAADKIYASDVSLVGSVGVISSFFNVAGTMEKIGIENKTIFRGKDKAAMFPFVPWKEGDDTNIQAITEYMYDQFVDVVVENRPQILRQKLIEEYGAQVYPAPKALQLGYIDGVLASENEALQRLTEEAGIADNYQVIRMDSRSWIDQLFRGENSVLSGKIQHEVKFPWVKSDDQLEGILYLYEPFARR